MFREENFMSKKGSKGKGKTPELPREIMALQKKEAEARKGNKAKSSEGQGPLPAKEITIEDIKKFVRGEITLAQLEGVSRDQLYDFAELGYTMFKSGKLDDAQIVFEGLVTYNPYDSYFHSALGAIYQKQKKYDEALRQYDLAIKFNSQDTCSYTNRGETYLTLGRLKEAAKDFQKAIALDPDERDPWSMRSRALVIAVTNALKDQGITPGKK